MNAEFSFQTNFLPPPFSFAYVLSLQQKSDHYICDFQIEYLDRDDWSEEMLLEEGAVTDDYYEWKGALPAVWNQTIDHLLKNVEVISEQDPNQDFLYFKSGEKEGYISNVEEMAYTLQELMQAVYEISEKELPMEVEILIKKDKIRQIQLFASFAQRLLKVNEDIKPWEKLPDYLSFLENAGLYENPFENKDKLKSGVYVNYGDGFYFRINSLMGEADNDTIIKLISDKID